MRMSLVGVVALFLTVPGFVAGQRKGASRYEIKLRPAEIKDGDSALQKKLKERYNTALELANDLLAHIETGVANTSTLSDKVDWIVTAGLALHSDAKERIAVLEEAIRAAKHAERIAEMQHKSGIAPRNEPAKARYFRLSLEIRLLQEQERGKQ